VEANAGTSRTDADGSTKALDDDLGFRHPSLIYAEMIRSTNA
jgi:hypothetical protein